jgi:hypothetical protein
MNRRLAIWLALAAVPLSALLVSNVAGGSEVPAKQAHGATMTVARGGSPTASIAAARGVKTMYMSSSGTVNPSEYQFAVGKCPAKRSHPLSGWFSSTSTTVVLSENSPNSMEAGNREWTVGVTNLGTEAAEYTVGIVCAK